jgi:hypothetical protein
MTFPVPPNDSGNHITIAMKSLWFRTALLNLLIAAVLGAVLRFAFVEEITGMNYKNVLHGHSHVAMLGWVYLALYAFLIPAFLPAGRAASPFYRWLFWLTQISVVGMLVSFPVQGYGPVSIAFSTAHIVLSYAFVLRFFNDLPPPAGRRSFLLVTISLYLMVISTLGVWAMGPVMAMNLRGTSFYFLAVQFFLHVQFFGWFLFAVLALFMRVLEQRGLAFRAGPWRWFLGLLLVGTVLTFALPATWSQPLDELFALNSIGAAAWFGAMIILSCALWPLRRPLAASLSPPIWRLFVIAGVALGLMALMRGLTVVPALAVLSYTLRNFTIGFLHLFLLGTVTVFLFGYACWRGDLAPGSRRARYGSGVFLAGVILSETLLFAQGVLLWSGVGFVPLYYELLFGFSALMPVGVGLLLAAPEGRRPGEGRVLLREKAGRRFAGEF